MGDVDTHNVTPRWGNEARDRKALAIWHTLVAHCGPGIADGEWLDVGCGSGGIAAALAPKVRNITGIDPEPWETWVDAMNVHANLRLTAASFDATVAPLQHQSIDVVICNQVYEHVQDPIALLQNIHHVLRPGGVCYFAGPNLLWPIEPHVYWPFVHWLPRKFAIRLMTFFRARRVEYLDAWLWTSWRLIDAFKNTGYDHHVAIRERIYAQAMISGSAVASALARLPHGFYDSIAPLAPSFVFVLRKPNPKNK